MTESIETSRNRESSKSPNKGQGATIPQVVSPSTYEMMMVEDSDDFPLIDTCVAKVNLTLIRKLGQAEVYVSGKVGTTTYVMSYENLGKFLEVLKHGMERELKLIGEK